MNLLFRVCGYLQSSKRALRTVSSNYSFAIHDGSNLIFPYSEVSKRYSIHRSKCTLIISHGIDPFITFSFEEEVFQQNCDALHWIEVLGTLTLQVNSCLLQYKHFILYHSKWNKCSKFLPTMKTQFKNLQKNERYEGLRKFLKIFSDTFPFAWTCFWSSSSTLK